MSAVATLMHHIASLYRVFQEVKMELHINSTWTQHQGDVYIAEALAWSENGNHAAIYATGITADEADAKLMGALCELKLVSAPERKECVS